MAAMQLTSNLPGYQSLVYQVDPRIRPLRFSKEHVEGRKFNILYFTTQFFNNNEELGHIITRIVVEFFWMTEIWSLYPTDSPERRRLIGQAHSPKYEVYWQKKLDPDAFKAKRIRQSSAELWSFPRTLSKDEKKDQGLVILGNHDWEYILPEVQLMPLYNVFFLELAKKIVATNPGKPLSIELMRRLWRLLVREVYDFVDEAEKTAKLEEAKAVTDEEFEEAMRSVSETLSKKHGILPDSESEGEPGNSRKQQSKKSKTVRFAEAKGSGSQMGTNESELECSTVPKPSAATNGHEPVDNSKSSIQDPKPLEQTKEISELAAKLAAAQEQNAELKQAKRRADLRWDSQHGQLKAAERSARELRKANTNAAHNEKVRNDAEHKIRSLSGGLKKAKDRMADLEGELRAAKRKIASLETALAKDGVEARGEKIVRTRSSISYRQ